jgi:hypothetical protein
MFYAKQKNLSRISSVTVKYFGIGEYHLKDLYNHKPEENKPIGPESDSNQKPHRVPQTTPPPGSAQNGVAIN